MDKTPKEPAPISFEALLEDATASVLNLANVVTSQRFLIQIAIIGICYAIAAGLARGLTPLIEKRLRLIEKQPQLMRLLIIPLRRLKWILFALIMWAAFLVMREFLWASRSYHIGIAVQLVTAGVVISIASRLIRNRSVANLFAVVAWSLAALSIIGLLDDVAGLLDKAAFSIGAFRLSILLVLKGAFLLVALVWLASVVGDFIDRRIRNALELEPTVHVLIGKSVKFILLATAVLASLSAIGLDLTVLTVFSGAVGLGIGFGLQKVASNLISGIIILIDGSIKPGDVIEIDDTFGWISSLKARYVSMMTRDGVEYLIPNENFVSEQVVNWSHSNRAIRLEIPFGVSYDSDPHEIRKLAVASVSELPRVIATPSPVCHMVAFGDSSLDFVLRFWIMDPQGGVTNIKGAAFLALWDAFKEAGVDIPFPHRDVALRGPVTIARAEPSPESTS